MTAMAKAKRDAESMTGRELKNFRETAFGLTQVEMAALLGVGLRTYVRLESSAQARRDIPLNYAKHVRCLLRDRNRT